MFNQMETVMNACHIRVKKICASCQHKDVENDGTRVCTKMQLKVPQQLVCPQWQMAEGLKNAGLSGGVVRLKGTQEIIIK